jgi:hypothetical protein
VPEWQSHLTRHYVRHVPQLALSPAPSTPVFWPPTARGAAGAATTQTCLTVQQGGNKNTTATLNASVTADKPAVQLLLSSELRIHEIVMSFGLTQTRNGGNFIMGNYFSFIKKKSVALQL